VVAGSHVRSALATKFCDGSRAKGDERGEKGERPRAGIRPSPFAPHPSQDFLNDEPGVLGPMGLCMAQMFLRDFDPDRFTRSVAGCWTRHLKEDKEQAHRQLVVLFGRPWVALLDSAGRFEKELALDLTAEAGGEAVLVAVDSAFLTWEAHRAAKGRVVENRVVPSPEPDGRMPLYADAELEAWMEMQRLGVPPELRYLRIRELEMQPAGEGGKPNAMVFDRPAPVSPVRMGAYRYRVRDPRDEESGPIAEFDRYERDGLRVHDTHVIQGRPDDERADHLLGVFDSIGRGKPRPDGYVYSPVLTTPPGSPVTAEELRAFLKRRAEFLSPSRGWAFEL